MNAEQQTILEKLGELRGMVRFRTIEQENKAAEIVGNMASRLARYPAGKVLATIDEWPERSGYWPTLKDFLDLMNELYPEPTTSQGQRQAPELQPEDAFGSEVAQHALRNYVGWAFYLWRLKNPTSVPTFALVDRLIKDKIEAQQMYGNLIAHPDKHFDAARLIELYKHIEERSNEYRARFMRETTSINTDAQP